MQESPVYGDVVAEVRAFLAARTQACRQAGLLRSGWLLVPGFGFGKTVEQKLCLAARHAPVAQRTGLARAGGSVAQSR